MMRFKTFLASVTFLTVTSIFILGLAIYQANAQKFFLIEAEDFDASQGESWQVLTPPVTVMTNPASSSWAPELDDDGTMMTEFTINDAYGDIIGNSDLTGVNGDWVKYVFDVPVAGDWYIWARVVAATIGDNSWYIGVDISDDQAVSADDDNMNTWDFHEAAEVPDDDIGTALNTRMTTKWVWLPLCSRTGNPFPGTEAVQFGPNPVPLPLTAGEHTFHIAWREATFGDQIFGTMEHPSVCSPYKDPGCVVAVEPQGKLTTTWGQLKHTR